MLCQHYRYPFQIGQERATLLGLAYRRGCGCGCNSTVRSHSPGQPAQFFVGYESFPPASQSAHALPLFGRPDVLEALGDDGGDALISHGDAVDRIRDLHRPLLVGDDNELGGVL